MPKNFSAPPTIMETGVGAWQEPTKSKVDRAKNRRNRIRRSPRQNPVQTLVVGQVFLGEGFLRKKLGPEPGDGIADFFRVYPATDAKGLSMVETLSFSGVSSMEQKGGIPLPMVFPFQKNTRKSVFSPLQTKMVRYIDRSFTGRWTWTHSIK